MFTFAGKQCVDPLKLFEQCAERELPTDTFAGRANSFTVRPGDTPSSGHVLMRREELYAVNFAAYQTLTIVDHLGHSLSFKQLYIVSAVRAVAGAKDDREGVYLVEIADNRRRLAMVPIDKAYNLRTQDGTGYVASTTDGGTEWTWADMIEDLWAAVGATFALGPFPGLPAGFTPDGTPEGFDFYGGFALASLVFVLRRVGCDLQCDHSDGSFSIVRQGGGTDATYFTSWKADEKFNGQALRGAAATRPQKVRVRFRVLPVPDSGSPYYFVDVSLAAVTGVLAGSVAVVDDDMAALGSSPSNSAALTARANERAADWLRRFDNLDIPSVVQYREYLRPAADAVGERRAVAIFEDVGDGYTTESHSAPITLPATRPFFPPRIKPGQKQPLGTPCVEYGLYGAIVKVRQPMENGDGSADCVEWKECDCGSTGQISGFVTDHDTGAPVPGRDLRIGGLVYATTNDAGWYLIDSLSPASYAVEVVPPHDGSQYRVDGGTWTAGTTSSSVAVTAGGARIIDFRLTFDS